MSENSQTKTCKHCKTEIPKGAKVCPQCRKKQGGGFLKWILIVVVALVIIGVATSGSDDNKAKKVDNNTAAQKVTDANQSVEVTEAQTEKTHFTVGETAEQKNIQVTLVSATESNGSEYVTPDDGNVFLLLEFEIVNNSDKDISISSIMNFEAYCDDYSLNQDLLGLQAPEIEGKGQLDGSVAAGKKMNGVIAYQVPSGYTNFEVSVTPDFWSSNNIKFIIEK